jgi:hypothetical protein
MATKKITNIRIGAAALVAVSAIGCGGSSGISDGFPSSPSTVVGKPVGPGVNGGSALAALTVGRTYQYAVTGTVTKDYLVGTNVQTISAPVENASLTRVVSAAPDGVAGHFQFTDTLTYSLQGGVPTVEASTWLVSQGADNSISIIGETKFSVPATTTPAIPLAPGTFSQTTNLSGDATLTFGLASYIYPVVSSGKPDFDYVVYPGTGTLQTAVTALGTENVPASSGSYTAWKTQTTVSDSWNVNGLWYILQTEALNSGFVVSSKSTKTLVEDWVPSIAAPVRSYETLSETDNVSESYSFTVPTYEIDPTVTYAFAPPLNKKETLEMILTGWK